MIQPVEFVEGSKTLTSEDMCYEIVAWGNKLPEFDPLKMLKAVVLSPQNVKKFNRTVIKFSNLLEQSMIVAVVLRFATFVVSAHVGRILAPIAAALHIFPIIVFASGMRVEYVKITVCTFDFGFSFVANTLWAMVLSSVLMDYRAVLVIMCWINFTNSLLQGTHLRNTAFMVGVTLGECLFYVMLMIWLTLDFVDEVHHYTLVTARGRTLSTKDVLANVVGTMTMLSLRNLYCRYQHLQQDPDRLCRL
ncbi:unnamed protein product [Phytophthora lilii]|uniref:Unnamed protein product n=1 Tax=Phytophthora lilii TaxID=2077276 RepID=A0A9W6U4G5_9STRA|nr:unnamed protein product [Phytophthora lilii]